MKDIILSIACILLAYSIEAQRDNVWVMRDFTIDFSEKYISLNETNTDITFDRTKASICDDEGNILFYSNGCGVYNVDNQLMPNGDSINYNIFYDDWIEGCKYGYLSSQGMIVLPDPANDYGYYIIHKPSEINRENGDIEFTSDELRYSYVDMRLDAGRGAVTNKNEVFLKKELKKTSYLSAMQHNNQKDWWIVDHSDQGNTYYSMLLTHEGFTQIDSQSIGPNLHIPPPFITGNARFSPDGSKFAYFNVIDGLHLYDFDRSTGLFSNGRYLAWEPYDQFNWNGTIEFSPNSKYIYICNEDQLFQLDMYDISDPDNLILIDEYNGDIDPFRTHFSYMKLAPDCKIYVAPGSSSNVYHIIHEPNKRGADCNFIQVDLRLPVTSSSGGFPYFPRFRVDENTKCCPYIPDCPADDQLIFCKEWPSDTLNIYSINIEQENLSLTFSSMISDGHKLFYLETCSAMDSCTGVYYDCDGRVAGYAHLDSLGSTLLEPDSITNYVLDEILWTNEEDIPFCNLLDEDGDGFFNDIDCDDTNPEINPAKPEIAYNSWDDDCDPLSLDDDLDEDGFLLVDDCDDNNELIYPNAVEIPNNGVDEDCDGMDMITSTINDHESSAMFDIFPNPSYSIVNIRSIQSDRYTVKVFDFIGRLILIQSFQSEISLTNLPKGLSFFKIYNKDGKLVFVSKHVSI